MHNFNKKRKIILGILIAIIVSYICYYVYAKEGGKQTQLELENNLEIEKEEQEYNDNHDKILVHVSGAVNKEGVVELKINSRICDAIEEARGSKRRC